MSNARSFFASRCESSRSHISRPSLPAGRRTVNPQSQPRGGGRPGREGRQSRNEAGGLGQYEPGMLLQDGPSIDLPIESDDDNIMMEEPEGFSFDSFENVSSHCNTEDRTLGSIKILLQQQQALLQSVVAKQEAFETFQANFEKKFEELEEKLSSQSQTVSSSDGSSPNSKRKRLVTRELTVSIIISDGTILTKFELQNMVSKTHKNLETGFRVNERYNYGLVCSNV